MRYMLSVGCWRERGEVGRWLGRPIAGGLVDHVERCDGSVSWSAKARAVMGGSVNDVKNEGEVSYQHTEEEPPLVVDLRKLCQSVIVLPPPTSVSSFLTLSIDPPITALTWPTDPLTHSVSQLGRSTH